MSVWHAKIPVYAVLMGSPDEPGIRGHCAVAGYGQILESGCGWEGLAEQQSGHKYGGDKYRKNRQYDHFHFASGMLLVHGYLLGGMRSYSSVSFKNASH